MIGKYERCTSCPRLILAYKIKDKKKPLCDKCESADTNKFAPKKDTLAVMKPSVYIEEEAFFEDDPRALKENDVGRVRRNPTHVNSSSSIDNMS